MLFVGTTWNKIFIFTGRIQQITNQLNQLYLNSFKSLMIQENEADFDELWDNLKTSITKPPCILKYFEEQLLPAFNAHSSIWVLKNTGIADPESAMTNNPPDSMDAVLHNLRQWKQVQLDVICVSLLHLSCYYQREIMRGQHLCGSWILKF